MHDSSLLHFRQSRNFLVPPTYETITFQNNAPNDISMTMKSVVRNLPYLKCICTFDDNNNENDTNNNKIGIKFLRMKIGVGRLTEPISNKKKKKKRRKI